MQIFKEIEPLRAFLKEKRKAAISIGLVPTMGALHQGHLSLIKACKAENDLTVCTIYVNPTQFNNPADLDKYPRSQEADIKLLETENCDLLFMPSNFEMYPKDQELKFDFGHLDKVMEGKFRPGHFSGVGLVVSKLFNIVQADRAYFGQKDYQQLQIITHLAEALKFNTQIRSIAIEREASGLALSSRNQRLSSEDKTTALLLFDSLTYTRQMLSNGSSFDVAKKEVESRFNKTPKVKLEYFELANKETLLPMHSPYNEHNAILLIAAYVNEVRLIDNMLLKD